MAVRPSARTLPGTLGAVTSTTTFGVKPPLLLVAGGVFGIWAVFFYRPL